MTFNVKTTKGLNLEIEFVKQGGLCFLTACALENGKKQRVGKSNFILPGRYGWLNHIKVNPDFRGKGIGYEMLALIEQICGVYGSPFIRGKYIPESPETESFYKKMGYAIYYDEDLMSDVIAGGGLDHNPHFLKKAYVLNLITEKENEVMSSNSKNVDNFDSEGFLK